MNALKVDLSMVRKYNVPGPRYTSYPSANLFTEKIPLEGILEAVRRRNESKHEISLYCHLPFCRSLCWYCGCTTVITRKQGKSGRYLEYLKKEMDLTSALLNPESEAVQLHFGGGTPTFLLPDELRSLGELIHSRFKIAPDVEAGVEMDPRELTRDHLKALREIGFNRASVGVQDNNPEVQRAVHRIQPYALTEKTIGWIREAGFKSLNIDLIYGLPFQRVASFEKTLEEVVALQPDRFAVFSYAHVPWVKRAQRLLRDEILPTPETKLQLLKLTIEKLTSEGYVYIGMDHFARKDDELAKAQRGKTLQRNFQGYSTRGGADIHAFGMSSISQADGVYWQNQKDLKNYYRALDNNAIPFARGYILNEDDKIRRRTITRLMCDLSLDFKDMSGLLQIDFQRYFTRELDSLADLEADGLLLQTGEGLLVTDLGRLFIRNIAMRFDAYQTPSRKGHFSKTI